MLRRLSTGITFSSPSSCTRYCFLIMPPKKRSTKSEQAGVCSWLEKFCNKQGIPLALVEVLAEHQITSETILAGITEQDLADMHLVAGHKILLRRVITSLTKSAAEPTADLASSLPGTPLPEVSSPLQPFKLEDELAKIEAEFCESKAATLSPQTTDQVSPPQAPSVDFCSVYVGKL